MLKLTIFLPITRKDRLPKIGQQMRDLDTSGFDVSILAISDNKDVTVDDIKRVLPDKYHSKILTTGLPGASEFNIQARRGRITDVFTMARKHISPYGFVFVVEDDTDINSNALQCLSETYAAYSYQDLVGLVSGVQCGRHGFKMLGLWRAESDNVMVTLPYQEKEMTQQIDASGFYCMLTKAELFKSAKFRYGAFGPDVCYGVDLSKKGYQNFVDWRVRTGHDTGNKVLWPDANCITIKYVNVDGEWMLVNPESKKVIHDDILDDSL